MWDFQPVLFRGRGLKEWTRNIRTGGGTYWIRIWPDTARHGADISHYNSRPAGSGTAAHSETQTTVRIKCRHTGALQVRYPRSHLDEDVTLAEGRGAVTVLCQITLVCTGPTRCSSGQVLNTQTAEISFLFLWISEFQRAESQRVVFTWQL